MPLLFNSVGSPIPESKSNFGVPIAPADNITSFFAVTSYDGAIKIMKVTPLNIFKWQRTNLEAIFQPQIGQSSKKEPLCEWWY